jgi:hypothetical protein
MRTHLCLAGLAVTAAAAAAVVIPTGAGAAAAQGDSVATVRAATAGYHDIATAIADGYVPTDNCTSSPAGVMGYHYVKPALLRQPIDVRHPAILIYQPSGQGRKLVAVEYFKADADQNLGTDFDRPSLLGQEFQGPMPGHEPGMPIHYDLHAWVWQNNPSGVFEQWNPAGSC